MSLQIPTTAELNAALIAALEAAFGQTIPIWAKAFLRVFPKSLAGLLTILYKYGGSMFLQMFVQYAGTETITVNGKRLIPLVEWGRLVGAGDPTPATRAEYDITVTVVNQTGSLAINTPYRNPFTGVIYLTLADVPLTAPTVTARIRAYRDPENNDGKGEIGNMEIGRAEVSLVTPLPDVLTDALVITEIVTGVDAESWEEYRQRVIDRFRSQPQGGAPIDYRLWGVEAAGIIRIYPYKGDPGEVDVYSEADTSISPDGIPTAGQLAAVEAAIELDVTGLASRRPVSSLVNSLPITRSAFNVTISGLQGAADPDALEDLIEESLVTYFLSREPFIPGLSLGARLDNVTRAAIGGVIQDTASAYGAIYDYVIVDKVSGPGDFSVYVLTEGEKAKLGTASFV
jgi:hypothetical protein